MSFNFATILSSITGVAPAMKSLVQQAFSAGNLVTMAQGVLSGNVVAALESTAETLFPKVAPEIRLAAALVTTYDHDHVKWLQGALNSINGDKALVVDGIYGQATVAAVTKFQEDTAAEFGLSVDGFAYKITNGAINAVLQRLLTPATTAQAPKLAPSQLAGPAEAPA